MKGEDISFYDQTSDEEKRWYCIKTDRSSELFGDFPTTGQPKEISMVKSKKYQIHRDIKCAGMQLVVQ